jgi:hypothetical protein
MAFIVTYFIFSLDIINLKIENSRKLVINNVYCNFKEILICFFKKTIFTFSLIINIEALSPDNIIETKKKKYSQNSWFFIRFTENTFQKFNIFLDKE